MKKRRISPYYRLHLFNRIKLVLKDGKGDHSLHKKFFHMDKLHLWKRKLYACNDSRTPK